MAESRRRPVGGTDLHLGDMSHHFEAPKSGIGTVSGGVGDPGGKSYGRFQMTSVDTLKGKDGKIESKPGGTVGRFLQSPEGRQFASSFGETINNPTDPKFSKVWQDIARTNKPALEQAELGYMTRTHYTPQARALQKLTGIDLADRSETLRQATFSTAVHLGPNSSACWKAIKARQDASKEPLTDHQVMETMYHERFRKDANGVMVHFHRAWPANKAGLNNRARNEPAFAREQLDREAGPEQSRTQSRLVEGAEHTPAHPVAASRDDRQPVHPGAENRHAEHQPGHTGAADGREQSTSRDEGLLQRQEGTADTPARYEQDRLARAQTADGQPALRTEYADALCGTSADAAAATGTPAAGNTATDDRLTLRRDFADAIGGPADQPVPLADGAGTGSHVDLVVSAVLFDGVKRAVDGVQSGPAANGASTDGVGGPQDDRASDEGDNDPAKKKDAHGSNPAQSNKKKGILDVTYGTSPAEH